MPSLRLDGRRALVTGASSGIGLGCAAALAEAGAHVTCMARRAEPLADAVAQLRAKGWQAEALVLDMTDLDALQPVMAQPFDVILNSAGTTHAVAALEFTPEQFDRVMNLNIRAAYFLSIWGASAMQAAGIKGSIIHMSSQMGHVGGQKRTVYCASKWAIEGMVKAMAIEWGSMGIRINAIAPTFIRTALTQSTFDDPDARRWIEDKIKLGRTGEVEDIMGAALYLACDASALVTGTSLLVDGGWTAG